MSIDAEMLDTLKLWKKRPVLWQRGLDTCVPGKTWPSAVGTPIAVQQKLMRHVDIRTTMNVYRDVVTDEMAVASGKITHLALNGR